MTLTSERLKYQKFAEEDFADYLNMVSQIPVMQYISGKGLLLEQAKTKYKKVLKINEEFAEIGVFSVRSLSTDEFIGLAKLTFVRDGEVEIGYSMLPKFWRKGYGTEMSARMIQLAKETPYVTRVMAFVDPENVASIKILTNQKLSFSEKSTYDGLPALIYRLDLT